MEKHQASAPTLTKVSLTKPHVLPGSSRTANADDKSLLVTCFRFPGAGNTLLLEPNLTSHAFALCLIRASLTGLATGLSFMSFLG